MGAKDTKVILLPKSRSKQKVGGSSKKGRQHVVHQKKCQKQFYATAQNKEKAWTRHLKNHPNDAKAKEFIPKARASLKGLG